MQNNLVKNSVLTASINSGYVLIPNEMIDLFGKSAASLLQKIHFWSNTESGLHFADRKWIYNTLEEWAEQLKCSKKTIIRAVKALRDAGVLMVKKLHRHKNNRTNYYAINYETLAEKSGLATREIDKNVPMDRDKMSSCNIQRLPEKSINKSEPVESASASEEILETSDLEKREGDNTASVQSTNTIYKTQPVKGDTVKQMLDLFNKIVMQDEANYCQMNKTRARFFGAALKHKFAASLDEWKKFCNMVAESDYLMGRAKNAPNFKLSLDWMLRFDVIDRMMNEEFGCKKPQKSAVEMAKELYTEAVEHIAQETNEILKEAKKKILNFLHSRNQLGSFKVWLANCSWGVDDAQTIVLKVESKFKQNYINTHFASDMACVLRQKVVCVAA